MSQLETISSRSVCWLKLFVTWRWDALGCVWCHWSVCQWPVTSDMPQCWRTWGLSCREVLWHQVLLHTKKDTSCSSNWKQAFIMCELKCWGVQWHGRGECQLLFFKIWNAPAVLRVWDFPPDQVGWERSHDCISLKLTVTILIWLCCRTEFCSVPRVQCSGVTGLSPFALIPAAFWDGGQFWDVSVAVQVLGSPPGHDPLQPSVVGFAAFRGGILRQTQGHTLTPKQELTITNLEPKHSSMQPYGYLTNASQKKPASLMGSRMGFKMVPVNSSLFTGHEANRLKKVNLFLSAQPEIWSHNTRKWVSRTPQIFKRDFSLSRK